MTDIEGFPWTGDPEVHEFHSQHTQPVRGCLACEDALAEARALQAEAPWNERR